MQTRAPPAEELGAEVEMAIIVRRGVLQGEAGGSSDMILTVIRVLHALERLLRDGG